MKSKKLQLYLLVLIIFLAGIAACNAEKDVVERRNLMIPKKSELPRNYRYKEKEAKKTYKAKKKKKKNKSLF